MVSDTNVVSLNVSPEQALAKAQAAMARFPSPVHKLRELSEQTLKRALTQMFDKVDDALFDMADKAQNNQDQNLFFESMREVRIGRRRIEQYFQLSQVQAFADLASYGVELNQASSPELGVGGGSELEAADTLSLVQNDALEEMVAVDSMSAKALQANKTALKALARRMAHVLDLTELSLDVMPLAPRKLCQAFASSAAQLDIHIKARLVLFKLFDKLVIAQLDQVYKQGNQCLIDGGVLPALKLSQASASAEGATRKVGSEEYHARQGQESVVSQKGVEALDALKAFQSLKNTDELSSALSSDTIEAPSVVSQDALLSLLTRLQQVPDSAAIQTKLPQIIQRNIGKLGGVVGGQEQDVISLVSMLFQFITEDRNLADTIKYQLTRLQIPYIKLALQDRGFFSAPGHPARRLLNELSTAAIGWVGESRPDKALLSRIEAIIEEVSGQASLSSAFLSSQLTELVSYLEKEKRRARLVERRMLDAEDGKAKTDAAEAEVDQLLIRVLAGQELPELAKPIVEGVWRKVLFVTHLKYGEASEPWVAFSQTLEELVWSLVEPMTTETRPLLLALIPKLSVQIQKGLEVIAYSPFDTSKLFQVLEQAHIARLASTHQKSEEISKDASSPLDRASMDELPSEAHSSGEVVAQGSPARPAAANAQQGVVGVIAVEEGAVEASGIELERAEALANSETENPIVPRKSEPENSLSGVDDRQGLDAEAFDLKAQDLQEPELQEPELQGTVSGLEVGSLGVAGRMEEVAVIHSGQGNEEQAALGEMEALLVEADEALGLDATGVEPEDKANDLPSTKGQDIVSSQADQEVRVSQADNADPLAGFSQGTLKALSGLTQGAWFEYSGGVGAVRCRLAAIIKSTDKYIFVDRGGIKVLDLEQLALGQALESGELTLLEDGVLFDRALSSVIEGLRQGRTALH